MSSIYSVLKLSPEYLISKEVVGMVRVNVNVVRLMPELEGDEVLIWFLSARKKYGGVSRSYEVLARGFFRRTDENYVLQKVDKIVAMMDGFYDRNTGRKIPKSSMVCYVDLNPKSAIKGYFKFVDEMNKYLYDSVVSENRGEVVTLFRRLDVKLFSAVHRSQSRTLYWLVDVDSRNKDLLDTVLDILGGYVAGVNETRGGFHVIVHRDDGLGRMLFGERVLARFGDKVEVMKQCMTPLILGGGNDG